MKDYFYITSKDEVINRYDGADKKRTVIDENGEPYLLKLPSKANHNNEVSYSNNVFSEYIGCHIYETLEIDAQKTYLGIFQNNDNIEKYACACKDFTNEQWKLIEFQKLSNSYDNDFLNIRGGSTELKDIEEILSNHYQINDKIKLKNLFWDMFIVDGLIGNFDRHNGNWGILVNTRTNEMKNAPVYDCGSCLFSQLADEQMVRILNSQEQINIRIYDRPLSAIKINDKKINYYTFINSLENKECNDALLRIMPKINMDRICLIIDNTPYISEIRKQFYKTILSKRYEKILMPAYEKIKERCLDYKETNRDFNIEDNFDDMPDI